NGHVKGEAVHAVIETPDDFAKFKGQLRGKFVLTQPLRAVNALWDPIARRFTGEQLRDMQTETHAAARGGRGGRSGAGRGPVGGPSFAQQRTQFFKDEGALALVTSSTRSDAGNVLLGGASANRAPDVKDLGLPQVVIAIEHYGRIARTLERKMPVT